MNEQPLATGHPSPPYSGNGGAGVLSAPQRLRRCLRDVAILAGATTAGEPGLRPVAEGLADVLLDALPLDWVHVRLADAGGGTPLAIVRNARHEDANVQTEAVGQALAPWLAPGDAPPLPALPNPMGEGQVYLAVAPLGDAGQDGVLVAASRRPDFPGEEDRLLLDAAAGQAAVVLRCRRAEDELARQRLRADRLGHSERRFRRLLEKLPAGAYACDAAGLITYFNQHAVQLWGRAPKLNDPVDRFCGSFKLFAADGTPITHADCWMALALQTGEEYLAQEILVERPDGSRLTVLAHAAPLHDDAGNLLGAVNILVDITEQKRAQEALREMDRRKDEFLATLAHELRNPLAAIRNALHILRKTGGGGEAGGRVRDVLERQVGNLVRLVDDLLDVSRVTRGKIELRRERVELAAVVRSALETSRPLLDEAGHELTVSLPPEPVYLWADPLRLAQVFLNLLNNAAKYTEPGGRIRLGAELAGNEVLVRVRDTGVGIPAEMLPRVFDLFVQGDRATRYSGGGLGIGLSLVRSLVQLHGGTVRAHSAGPGQGSEFVVRLPLAAGHNGSSPAVAAGTGGGKPCAARGPILVIDDNRDAADCLGLLLHELGHEVRVAHDGLSALAAAGTCRPAVVFLDLGMPGMDGYEVARTLRARPGLEGVVLIALTGWGQEEARRRSRAAGFDHHLLKPVDVTALQALLASL
jgi:PAS domain S-box-containing protein